MENTRVFKKGEHLFKSGDKVTSIFAIQTGSVSVYVPRPKQNIEIYVAGNNQFVGEQGLHGVKNHLFSAVATSETKVFEIPLDFMKGQIESASQMLKLYAKSMGERCKFLTTELKSYRMERDNSPCPLDTVPKAFGVFYHVAHHLGNYDEKTKKTVVDWRQMRLYSHKVFQEPLRRLEGVLNIFIKLKLVEPQILKNEEDPKAGEELAYIHVTGIEKIYEFFDYYQHYFFKSGKADLLRVDEPSYMILSVLMKEAENNPPDNKGVCRVSYPLFTEAIKNELGIQLANLHFDRLEQKGLFVKRAALQDGGEVIISFDFHEFARTHFSWKVLREIDKWNDRGYVDVKEVEVIKKLVTEPGTKTCTACNGTIQESNKFCPSCGIKLAA